MKGYDTLLYFRQKIDFFFDSDGNEKKLKKAPIEGTYAQFFMNFRTLYFPSNLKQQKNLVQ